MAYEKQTWATGDVVTSAKLNHLEDGVADAGGVILTQSDGVLDHTWQEIYDAAIAGKAVYYHRTGLDDGLFCVDQIAVLAGNTYSVTISSMAQEWTTSSADGYPGSHSK